MRTLQEILAEVQAIDATSVDAVQAAVAQIVTDLQAQIDAQAAPVVSDPVVSVTTTTQSGVTATFVPQS